MMKLQMSHEFDVRTNDNQWLTVPDLHFEGERLMEALLKLEKCNDDIADSSTATDGDCGTLTVELLVTAESVEDAVAKFMTIVRTAIHDIGGVTSGWPTPHAEPGNEYEPTKAQWEYV